MTERNSAWYKMTRRFEGKTESVLQITSAVGFFPEPRILMCLFGIPVKHVILKKYFFKILNYFFSIFYYIL